ncbi:MAG TPA: outer membrane beta-barrel protein [Methylocystis sp.]|nr:outer membrane beta-barrel protein [Methylocystis sp.]
MRKALLACAIAPLALAARPAFAADMPQRDYAPQPGYFSPTPVARWQGFYAGLNVGYGFSSFDNGGYAFVGNPNGAMIGFTAGYNFMPAPNLLIGAEADFDFAGLKTTQTPYFGVQSSGGVDDILTIRGRVGYAMDRLLIFATGGFAGSRNSVGLGTWWTQFYGQESKFQTGWTIGGGAEYLVTPNLSAKAEYLFTSVGSDRYFDFTPNALQSSVNSSLFRVGLNYHFF